MTAKRINLLGFLLCMIVWNYNELRQIITSYDKVIISYDKVITSVTPFMNENA